MNDKKLPQQLEGKSQVLSHLLVPKRRGSLDDDEQNIVKLPPLPFRFPTQTVSNSFQNGQMQLLSPIQVLNVRNRQLTLNQQQHKTAAFPEQLTDESASTYKNGGGGGFLMRLHTEIPEVDSQIEEMKEEEEEGSSGESQEVLEDDSYEEDYGRSPNIIFHSPSNSKSKFSGSPQFQEQQDMPPNTEPHKGHKGPILKGALKNKAPQSTMNLLSAHSMQPLEVPKKVINFQKQPTKKFRSSMMIHMPADETQDILGGMSPFQGVKPTSRSKYLDPGEISFGGTHGQSQIEYKSSFSSLQPSIGYLNPGQNPKGQISTFGRMRSATQIKSNMRKAASQEFDDQSTYNQQEPPVQHMSSKLMVEINNIKRVAAKQKFDQAIKAEGLQSQGSNRIHFSSNEVNLPFFQRQKLELSYRDVRIQTTEGEKPMPTQLMTDAAADEADALNDKKHPHRLSKKGRAETHTENFKFGNLIRGDTMASQKVRGQADAQDHKPQTGSILSAFKNAFLKKIKFSEKVLPHPLRRESDGVETHRTLLKPSSNDVKEGLTHAKDRAKKNWRKVRVIIKAINNWKKVRNDVLLYGTHNYEFSRTFNRGSQPGTQQRITQDDGGTPIEHSYEQTNRSTMKSMLIRKNKQDRFILVGSLSKTEELIKQPITDRSCWGKRRGGRNGCYLNPESTFKQVWSILIIILLIYVSFVMPFNLAFYEEDNESEEELRGEKKRFHWRTNWGYSVDIIADFVFFTDIFITSLTAFYDDKEGALVTDNKIIFKRYLKGWFVIDLIASLPYTPLEEALQYYEITNSHGSQQFVKLIRFLRIPRLHRLLEVSKLGQYFRAITKDTHLLMIQDFLQENAGMMRLMTIMGTVVVCVHVSACFWYMTARLSEFSEDTWVCRYGYLDSDVSMKYLVSLYWAIATILTVGYGDINGYTTLERCFSIIWMMVGVAFYTLTIGVITSVLDQIDTKESDLNQKLEIIESFCQEAQIPIVLQKKIQEALEYHSIRNAFSVVQSRHKTVFTDLPTDLKYEVAMQIHDGAISRLPFFQNRETAFSASLVPLLQPLKIQDGEYIYMKGDHPYDIFFIVRGRVNFLMDIGEVVFKAWPRGAYFGEIEIIFDKKRICSAKAPSGLDCDLFILNKKHYQTIIHRDFPEIDKQLRDIALERERRINLNIKTAMDVLKAIGVDEAEQDNSSNFTPFQEQSPQNAIKQSPRKSEQRSTRIYKKKSNPQRRGSCMSQQNDKDMRPQTISKKIRIQKSFNDVLSGSKSFNATSRRSKESYLSNLDSQKLNDSQYFDQHHQQTNGQLTPEVGETLKGNMSHRKSWYMGKMLFTVEPPSEEISHIDPSQRQHPSMVAPSQNNSLSSSSSSSSPSPHESINESDSEEVHDIWKGAKKRKSNKKPTPPLHTPHIDPVTLDTQVLQLTINPAGNALGRQDSIKNRLETLMRQLDQNSSTESKIQELEDQMQTMTAVIEKMVLKLQERPPAKKKQMLVQDIQDDEIDRLPEILPIASKTYSTVLQNQFYQPQIQQDGLVRSHTQISGNHENGNKEGSSTLSRPKRISLKDRWQSRMSSKQMFEKHDQ